MKRLAKSLAAASLLALALAAPAQGAFGVKEFSSAFINEDKTPALKAGTHPFGQVTSLFFDTVPYPNPDLPEVPAGDVKDVTVSLPPGFVGDPTAVTACSSVAFSEVPPKCPASSQVGSVEAFVSGPGIMFPVTLYNIEPPPGEVLKMGFHFVNVPVTIDFRVNPDPPFNVLASLHYTSNAVPIYGSRLLICGAPPGATKAFLTLQRACTGPVSASPLRLALSLISRAISGRQGA